VDVGGKQASQRVAQPGSMTRRAEEAGMDTR
jgi:hypothetical protein